eukprot:5080382-Prymnesium_polylepis.1
MSARISECGNNRDCTASASESGGEARPRQARARAFSCGEREGAQCDPVSRSPPPHPSAVRAVVDNNKCGHAGRHIGRGPNCPVPSVRCASVSR